MTTHGRIVLTIIAAILGGALAAAGLAQSGDAGWVKFSSAEGRFSILFPAKPEESSSTEKGVVLHRFLVAQPPVMYMALYTDYPQDVEGLSPTVRLQAERDGLLKGLKGGKLISEEPFKFKRGNTDLPALRFSAESADRSDHFKCIVVLDGARAYFLGVGNFKGSDTTTQVERFLGSFKLN
jgi:hypothetical protein